MSFRKRSEILSNPGTGRPAPLIAGRTLGGPIKREVPIGIKLPIAKQEEEEITKNPGVKPSLITSQPTISTGVADLDKILQHVGLPLGQSLLVQESGTTDFASIVLRAFTSQGIFHNRITKDLNCHCIIIGVNPQWSKELPGLYKGTTKEQKKAKIREIENKVSVSNLANDSSRKELKKDDPTTSDMKIAWRYGLNKKDDSSNDTPSTYEYYNNQFDITQKLVPGPSSQDISYLPLNSNYAIIIKQLESIIQNQLKSNNGKVIRIIIPNLLNPSFYSPSHTLPTFIFPFIHSLKSILSKFNENVVLISSLQLDLFPRFTNLTGTLENLFDSVIHLQPFNQEMSKLIEKAYKNEPSKIQHGLVNIIKLPILSDRGLMCIYNGEYAFKNGRKKFEIEDWGIPVDDDSKEENEGQTTKNIDF